jgi:hydrogenase maturation protein HypF
MSRRLGKRSLFNKAQPSLADISARKIILSGQVQGVGFRPFIYRLASAYNLVGWVRNCVGVVEIHAQGADKNLDEFLDDIFNKKPTLAAPVMESEERVGTENYTSFSVLQSLARGDEKISMPVDLFLCNDCLAEFNNPLDRRYRYPFINCTQCGPRYTLIHKLPYDRCNTSMKDFELCKECRTEYEDPANRRFHAEPVACPACGPTLRFQLNGVECIDANNTDNESQLKKALEILRDGKILAVKGIGGYHLMCDAQNTDAVMRLRHHKSRPHKPLAVMFPAPLDAPFKYAECSVQLNENDRQFLLQPDRSILLVKKLTTTKLSDQIAPGLNEVGMMLPYSPMHHLLLNDFAAPLVVTSANISGEPVLIHQQEVEKRLAHVVDAYLHHDRLIVRPADDPLYKTIAARPRPLRMGRGSAPRELLLPFELEQPVLAVGAQMKNVITLAWKNRAVMSPHIGDMDSARSVDVFNNTVRDLQALYGVTPAAIICDAHAGYSSARWAQRQSLPVHSIFHHHAHASAAYYESKTDDNVIVFSWDGVGYGEDGSLWGGETFVGKPGEWQRVASMRPFNLPGGDKAARQIWRSAAAICWECGDEYIDAPENISLLHQAWQKKINAPRTTSVGRLFDAAAALTGVCTQCSYEGQGPMQLEALSQQSNLTASDYIKLELKTLNHLLMTDWQPVMEVMQDRTLNVSDRAALFHNTLAHVILQQALAVREMHGVNEVCFSGGVFQNRVLTETAVSLLTENDFNISLAELIPVNDAGISLGQVIEYAFGAQQ